MDVYLQDSWSNGFGVNGPRRYRSERAMRAAVSKMLLKRAPGPMAVIEVFSKWGAYSGPDNDSYMGRFGFAPDGVTVEFYPVGTL